MEVIFYLLCHRLLALDLVEEHVIPGFLLPVYKSLQIALETGPITPMQVWEVARDRFGAKEEAKLFLLAVEGLTPHQTQLDTIGQQLALRRVVSKATEQLQTGHYDLAGLQPYLQVLTHNTEELIQKIQAPPNDGKRVYKIQTGLKQLDQALEGGLNNELVTIAGRPKDGKTSTLVNIVTNNEGRRALYISVSDLDYHDLCFRFHDIQQRSVLRDNLGIVDFTGMSARLGDVERVVEKFKPEILVVDRAEKLLPIRVRKDKRTELAEIWDGLRRMAKTYECPVFTDAQLSADGEEGGNTRLKREIEHLTFTQMAEDRTGRAAALDVFIGLRRMDTQVAMNVIGRRRGLPRVVYLHVGPTGRYL